VAKGVQGHLVVCHQVGESSCQALDILQGSMLLFMK
jgi:hypothetical protein